MSDDKAEPAAAPRPLTMVALKRQSEARDAANAAERRELADTITQLKGQVGTLESAIADLGHRFGRLEVAAPVELRALAHDSITKILEVEPYARFEVLEKWKHSSSHLQAGRIIRADHYPMLLHYVRAGLKLGIPGRQEDIESRYKGEAEARAETYRKEALARAEADAEAANVRRAALEK